jgi:hypothetical protein
MRLFVDVSRSVPQSHRNMIEKKCASGCLNAVLKERTSRPGGKSQCFAFGRERQGFSPAKDPANTKGFNPGLSFPGP